MNKALVGVLVGGIVAVTGAVGLGGMPLNNIEGVGGIAFNPLAYPAGNGAPEAKDEKDEDAATKQQILGLPQIGAWYVHLGDSSIDWTTLGAAETLLERVEVSYGHEIIGLEGADTIYKDNIGAKLLVIKEGKIVPAVSIGGVGKHTSLDVADGVDDWGIDVYLVGTKLIKELPRPVLLSGGLISTTGRTLGVLGFDEDRAEALFGNVDVLPLDNVAVGFEYRQGAHFDDFKNADYWNAHLAWFANKNLTLVGAYVNTGDEKSSSKVGLGDGFVLSAQYAF
jgi:hypothetical protein